MNYVLGAGKVYIDLYDSNDALTGERYIGNTPGFELQVSTEKLDHYNDDEGIRTLDDQVVTQINRQSTITCDNVTMENLALFAIADVATHTQAGGAVVDEPLDNVKKGHFYQLGVSASAPTGVRNISAVTVNKGATVLVAGTDYAVDAAMGRIEILAGSVTVLEGDDLLVDYTAAAATWEKAAASALGAKYAALRYIASNRQGANRDLYAPKVLIGPSGTLSMKGTEWQQVSFSADFQKKGDLAPVYLDGRPA